MKCCVTVILVFALSALNASALAGETYGVEDNEPPKVWAGRDVTVPYMSKVGTEVTLQGRATDNLDPAPQLAWYEDGVLLGTGPTLVHTFSVGKHRVVLKATDKAGNVGCDEVWVGVTPDFP